MSHVCIILVIVNYAVMCHYISVSLTCCWNSSDSFRCCVIIDNLGDDVMSAICLLCSWWAMLNSLLFFQQVHRLHTQSLLTS